METKTKVKSLNASTERKGYSYDQLVTVGDLDQFRNDLLKDIQLLLGHKESIIEKQWLKSFEVKHLLNISSGTLQHLRDTGQIPFTRLGGIIYYEYAAIKDILKRNE
jgi:hypothetical protein